jgi:thiol-disulfide isomerase/thioredoxin
MIGDNQSAEEEEIWRQNEVIRRQEVAGNRLVAARLTEQPAEGERLKSYVERELPPHSWPTVETQYWRNRARLAALEGSKADALTYYQKALRARKKAPEPFQGRVIDELGDEARALWTQLGGTETAWNFWSKPEPVKIEERTEAGWKKATKTLPDFELVDLAGKTWRLKDLAGRAVLINLWATWCGPCKAELPHLQKLYQQVKDRTDLQILTFSIDEDFGQVVPFMKEKGFTFPVLPAFAWSAGLVTGIPQNWIVDAKGVWQWEGMPNVPDTEWEQAMLKQIESAR